jgi:hypothetical protein
MTDAYDWVFDYAIVFLESDKFDAAVMDFVDEKCDVFDSEDENKFIYSDIHNEFREHIEALITSNLGEVGVTVEMFYESCERAGQSRDVNRAVFERMMAMEDFSTFKRIMVKRNMELQILAMQESTDGSPYSSPSKPNQSSLVSPMSPEEEKEQLDRALSASLSPEHAGGTHETDMMQTSLRNSLLEMEMINRQEELEQAELMKAVALSLAIEEERLKVLVEENERSVNYNSNDDDSSIADEKASADTYTGSSAGAVQGDEEDDLRDPYFEHNERDVKAADSKDSDNNNATMDSKIDGTHSNVAPAKKKKPKKKPKDSDMKDFEPLKPLKLRPLGGLAPLPSITSEPVPSREEVGRMQMELAEKKREAESVIRESQKQLASQRENEENLKSELNRMNPQEAERRAAHMREQRDRLIAKKKVERERKVQEEEERTRKANDERLDSRPDEFFAQQAKITGPDDSDAKEDEMSGCGVTRAEIEESRRGAMRNALARRMKMGLIETEDQRVAKAQELKFAELENKLKQVEQLRIDSRMREQSLNQKLRKNSSGVEDLS